MEQMDRSTFMKLAGAGSVAAAVPMAGKLAAQDDSRLQFKALGGLPKAPLPSYATHVVEGTVDLTTGTGIVTTRVLAGHPGGTSGVGLPGLARIIRIDRVVAERDEYRLAGVIDRKNGVVRAPFAGRQVSLPLA